MKLPVVSKLGIAPRLIILIVLILCTIFFVDRLSRMFVPMPDVSLVDEKWLSSQIVDAKAALEASPAAERGNLLDRLSESEWMNFSVLDHNPLTAEEPQSMELQSLKAKLQQLLGPDTSIFISAQNMKTTYERTLVPLTVIVTAMPGRLVDDLEDIGRGSMFVFTSLKFSVALSSGEWMVMQSDDSQVIGWRYLRVFSGPVFGIIIILALSFWAAYVLVKPLRQLSDAAEKLGRERSVTPIPHMNIPEYQAIADAFNNMQIQLKRFVDDRTQMLAAISHDLRTPLTRLRLIAEYIKDETQRVQVLSDLNDMQTMIEGSLAFASEEAKQEAYIPVDVASLLISLCDNVADTGRLAVYRGPDHASLRCQPVAMRRAFSNLIDNACKYGESVTVSLAEHKARIVILFEDKGNGIPESQMERAFAPFQRLEGSRNRETGGVGLGLAITRDIIHGHGGEITLANYAPKGLRVTVSLPHAL